jgi:hypothetical protein
MDMNAYVLELLIVNRLTEMRQHGERTRRLREALPPARPLRVVLGEVLIRMGRRVQGVSEYSLAALDARGVRNSGGGPSHGAVRG